MKTKKSSVKIKEEVQPPPIISKEDKMKIKNYCGMPDYAYEANPFALIYQARKPLEVTDKQAAQIKHNEEERRIEDMTRENKTESSQAAENPAAKRKVAHALLTMVSNETMAVHFVYRGGAEAVLKLIMESKDIEVLTTCCYCFLKATEYEEYCKNLTSRNITSFITELIEKGDQFIKLLCAKMLAQLTVVPGLEEFLVLGGAIGIIQALIATQRIETIYYAVVSLANIGPALVGPDAEQTLRIIIGLSKHLDMKIYTNAYFYISIITNFSRLEKFSSLLCDEGTLPILLHMMDAFPSISIVGLCVEAFVNLSANKKNRREIASSGIGNQLDKIFDVGTPLVKAYSLMMVGNLLGSNLFHDKIAREALITNMIEKLLDPYEPKQFVAVVFCISQLVQVDSSAPVVVNCGIIRKALSLLSVAPPEAIQYLWTILINISRRKEFFGDVMEHIGRLLEVLYEEISDGKSIQAAGIVSYNLVIREELPGMLTQSQIEMFAGLLKELFESAKGEIQETVLNSLVNFATYSPTSRKTILGKDLISVMEEAGLSNMENNVKFAALLNIVSNEANCSSKLLENGGQKFLVLLQNAINISQSTESVDKKKGRSSKPSDEAVSSNVLSAEKVELANSLIAATFHNMSLKRAIAGPGVLPCLLNLMKNCKTIRTLHVVRCLANMSAHPKSKLLLSKERRLIPLLTNIMRCGCEEADRVQHYGAYVITNILATNIDKIIMEELIKTDAIKDLVVVTRLRVNSIATKETLSKSLFNLLCRNDFRITMIKTLDILGALLELSKLESVDLLELAVRALYNVSCQIDLFEDTFAHLKIPYWIVYKLSGQAATGARPNTSVKFLLGMTLANLSFNNNLCNDLTYENAADTCFRIMALNTEEATLCSCLTLYNISKLENCKSMANSSAIPLLIQVLEKGPIANIQPAVAAITNLSMYECFFEQLTELAIAPMIQLLLQPQIGLNIKLDILSFIYNIVLQYLPARIPVIRYDGIVALYKFMKTQDIDRILITIARIVKELCTEAPDDEIHKKLVADGVMDVLFKLSKKEIPEVKFDCSCSMLSLTFAGDTMKVLKWDSVDILFWLTLYDSLGLYDPIRKNVGRTMRNFSLNPEEARILVKEERFMAVVKALGASTSEDVLWQVAGIIYNLMSDPDCRSIMLSRGVVNQIFEIAASGYESVKHVCSACLHMIPDDIPDMDNPEVLELVLCLLEVDDGRFAELGGKCDSPLPYSMPIQLSNSPFTHAGTNFAPTWITLTCDVDKIFSPALIPLPKGSAVSADIKGYGNSTIGIVEEHKKLLGADYFNNNEPIFPNDESNSGVSGDFDSTPFKINTSIPPPSIKPPPALQDSCDGYSFNGNESGIDDASPKPVLPQEIAFPKIAKLKPAIPKDTLGAIKSNKYKGDSSKIFTSQIL